MLFSQFILDGNKFVISAEKITEIIPLVSLKADPMQPEYVSGLLNYHTDILPVIDLCFLLGGHSCERKLSTRIIIVENGEKLEYPQLLGLIVEKATEMVVLDNGKFRPSPLINPDAIADGPVIEHQGEVITKITIEEIFSRVDKKIFPVNSALYAEA